MWPQALMSCRRPRAWWAGFKALHISSDNTTVSAFESVVKVCNENKIPLFVGDTGSVPRGAIAAYGLDYFLIGYTAGKQAAKILKGEKPGEVPAGMASGYSLWINLKAAQLQGPRSTKPLLKKRLTSSGTSRAILYKESNFRREDWRGDLLPSSVLYGFDPERLFEDHPHLS